ncbi:hypothetical protein NMY22_g2913 [Coprinellus aureogranulatus]|nr:hypothetical protein NMY22_g2913 [Coprinellus aureogranulatus]
MNIEIRYIPDDANEWTVTRAIATVVHGDDFAVSEEEKRVNFKVELNPNEAAGVGHNHTGILTVPSVTLGRKFLGHVRGNPIKVLGKKLHFRHGGKPPRRHVVATLDKTPFVDPDIEEKHVQTVWALDRSLRLEKVQFGAFFRKSYPGGRSFSVEWEKSYAPVGFASLKFEYDHKLLRLTVESLLVVKPTVTH